MNRTLQLEECARQLKRLLSDIEACACTEPEEATNDPNAHDSGAWFGPFETNVSLYDLGTAIEWPNLRIVALQAKQALDALEAAPARAPGENVARYTVTFELEEGATPPSPLAVEGALEVGTDDPPADLGFEFVRTIRVERAP